MFHPSKRSSSSPQMSDNTRAATSNDNHADDDSDSSSTNIDYYIGTNSDSDNDVAGNEPSQQQLLGQQLEQLSNHSVSHGSSTSGDYVFFYGNDINTTASSALGDDAYIDNDNDLNNNHQQTTNVPFTNDNDPNNNATANTATFQNTKDNSNNINQVSTTNAYNNQHKETEVAPSDEEGDAANEKKKKHGQRIDGIASDLNHENGDISMSTSISSSSIKSVKFVIDANNRSDSSVNNDDTKNVNSNIDAATIVSSDSNVNTIIYPQQQQEQQQRLDDTFDSTMLATTTTTGAGGGGETNNTQNENDDSDNIANVRSSRLSRHTNRTVQRTKTKSDLTQFNLPSDNKWQRLRQLMKSETKDSAVEPPPLSMHGRLRVHVTDTIIHPGEDHANDATRNFSNHTMVRTGGSRNLFDNTSSNSSSVNNGEGDTYDARKIPWRSLSSPVGGNGDDDSSSRNHNNEMNRDGITQHSVSVQQQFLSHNTSSSHATSNQKQYRLVRPPKPVPYDVMLGRMFGLGRVGNMGDNWSVNDFKCYGLSPDRMMVNFLHLSFRRSFLTFFIIASMLFWFLTLVFAVFIYILGVRDPDCVGGVDFRTDRFADAYALSWATFSTVGYGVVYVGLSADIENVRKCTGLTILVSLEAFVGMLFASLCCAILFIKVSRIQSIAQVAFSKPIVIRYGSALTSNSHDQLSDESSSFSAEELNTLPCPILEFRVANRMHNVMDGEIIDCTVNIAASVDASQQYHSVQSASKRRRGGRKGTGRLITGGSPRRYKNNALTLRRSAMTRDETPLGLHDMSDIELGTLNEQSPYGGSDRDVPSMQSNSSDFKSQTLRSPIDENLNAPPRPVFSKLIVEPSEHSFFDREWTIRHRLNEDSPLLKRSARQKLKRNNGFWPKELNNYEGVREAFHFESFVVSFSGTSNADCSSVYAQHVYDYKDVCVGYSFCNMLYQDNDEDEYVHVDMRMLNVIDEQAGGGGEPLRCPHSRRSVTDASKPSAPMKRMLAM